MDTRTLITIIRALVTSGQTDDQIAAVLLAMGPTVAPITTASTPRTGSFGSVAYRLRPGLTIARLQALGLPAQQYAIAAHVLAHGPQTRRALTDALQHATKKVTESAVHTLRTRGVLESVTLDTPPSAPAASRRAPVGPITIR